MARNLLCNATRYDFDGCVVVSTMTLSDTAPCDEGFYCSKCGAMRSHALDMANHQSLTRLRSANAAKDAEIERLREVVLAWLEAPFFADRNEWAEWSDRLGARARRALEGVLNP